MTDDINQPNENTEDAHLSAITQVQGLYEGWFLDYASYVILERAVPHIYDGLKPVQRRILHSLWEMDDGRYNKVANVIGNTMKYHPHGDASIGDAMVQIGQKNILLDCQGNWGNIYTGDSAAASRYIEVRLNKFGHDVVFNPKTTNWLASYDGRNKEPETLPVKFPMLLAIGVEGIAVGLACKILPHNFVELIDASIDVLKGKKTHIMPDFLTGGMADFSDYNGGMRGGKVRVRARIKKDDKDKTLIITEVPFGTTTGSLIDSILKANEKGKIKVKKIEDNTAGSVEIVVHLAPGTSPDKTIDALYAFTDCEISISPNSCVIHDDKPKFLPVDELLRFSTEHTKSLIRKELEIELNELSEQWHFASLEKIFIEKRIYRKIEECETWEDIILTIHKGLKPFVAHLLRAVTDEDVARLTEIRIKRISRFDSNKADDNLSKLEALIEGVEAKLGSLVETAINYFKELKHKYGKGKERKTEIKQFDVVQAAQVAIANAKLYANLKEGFVGMGLKKDEGDYIGECSDIDDIIAFRSDGKMMVSKVQQKAFFGKDLLHVAVWKKDDKRTIYNMIYRDGKSGGAMMKRFGVTAITRDKEYDLTKGLTGTEVLHFTANPNGEAEVVTVYLKTLDRVKKLKFDVDFAELAIKGRDAIGNVVTKHQVKKVELKQAGISTLGARKIWLDDSVMRLNEEGHGRFMGDFLAEDKLLVVLSSGVYKLIAPELSAHFDDNLLLVEKWIPEKPLTAVYLDGEKEQWFVKRFLIEASKGPVTFIGEHPKSKLGMATLLHHPVIYVKYDKRSKLARNKMDESMNLRDFIAVKGLKAIGNRLTAYPILNIELLDADPEREVESEKLLQSLIEARQPKKVEIDRNDEEGTGPQDEEHREVDSLSRSMEKFRNARIVDKKEKGPGKQASLF
jgi:topoisomerase IV subunit A